MAFLEFRNVKIAGFSAGVPKNVVNNLHPSEFDNVSADYAPEDFVATTGVKERRITDTLCTSDLCVVAAERLLSDLKWEREEIGAVIFVSQNADYRLPCTACIIQDRLGLSKECYALDCTLGCSGWVYGLSQVASLMNAGDIKKALLMVGDAKEIARLPRDPLFGHAGTVTAIEFCEGAAPIQFHLGTDGSGYDAIIMPAGGARNQLDETSLTPVPVEEKMFAPIQVRMKGMDVFAFGISTAPKSVKKLGEHYGFDYLDSDYFVFHQANKKMNSMITKKLKLPEEKVPYSMDYFGNTSSASIPMTIVASCRNATSGTKKFICCGFGVGLSWGTVRFQTEDLVISDLVEVDELTESKWA